MASKLVISLIEEGQEYQQYLAEEGARAARAAGFAPEVIYSEGNALVQIRRLFAYVHAPAADRPVAMLVLPVSGKGGDKLAQNAVDAGIGWVLLNREAPYIDELRRRAPKVPAFAVTVDHTEVGRVQGRLLRKLLPEGGPVLYVKGPPEAASAVSRHAGLEEVLRGSSIDLRIVFGDWTGASATKAVGKWLGLAPTPVRAIIAQNDDMAVAARAALLEAKLADPGVPVVGCDGLPKVGQRLVRERQMTATVVIPPPTTLAIDLLGRALRTGEAPPALTRLGVSAFPA